MSGAAFPAFRVPFPDLSPLTEEGAGPGASGHRPHIVSDLQASPAAGTPDHQQPLRASARSPSGSPLWSSVVDRAGQASCPARQKHRSPLQHMQTPAKFARQCSPLSSPSLSAALSERQTGVEEVVGVRQSQAGYSEHQYSSNAGNRQEAHTFAQQARSLWDSQPAPDGAVCQLQHDLQSLDASMALPIASLPGADATPCQPACPPHTAASSSSSLMKRLNHLQSSGNALISGPQLHGSQHEPAKSLQHARVPSGSTDGGKARLSPNSQAQISRASRRQYSRSSGTRTQAGTSATISASAASEARMDRMQALQLCGWDLAAALQA